MEITTGTVKAFSPQECLCRIRVIPASTWLGMHMWFAEHQGPGASPAHAVKVHPCSLWADLPSTALRSIELIPREVLHGGN